MQPVGFHGLSPSNGVNDEGTECSFHRRAQPVTPVREDRVPFEVVSGILKFGDLTAIAAELVQ